MSRWLNRLNALSFDLRYTPYLYHRTSNELKAKVREISLTEDKTVFYKRIQEEKIKIKSNMPVRIRIAWGPGKSPKEIATNINKVHNSVKEMLTSSVDKKVFDVGGIGVSANDSFLTSGKDTLSKGSLAFGVWQNRVLWYDEVHDVPFWVLRRIEDERLDKIVSELITWAQTVTLPDCMEAGTPEENKKVLMTAPIFKRLHPGTDIEGLEVGLITWTELAEACRKVQHAIGILNRCISSSKIHKVEKARDGMIEPKPPEIFAKILWMKCHWKEHWKLISFCTLVIVFSAMFTLPKFNLFRKKPDIATSTTIFAKVSQNGTILGSNDFPWEIRKSKDRNGDILFTIIGRKGEATAVSVVPDYPKCSVRQSYDGMVIIFTCSEKEISDFTINLKY